MKKLEYIPINIWDDFYDDGYVPEGEKLETYIYVEDSDMPPQSFTFLKISQIFDIFR